MNAPRQALIDSVREAYMEVFPSPSIEERLSVLPAGSYVAVTCSPSKGVDETLSLSAQLAGNGYKVVPHIAAKMVHGKQHLRSIVERIADLPIVSVFVPGGDAPSPIGDYSTAYDLLRDLAELDHPFTEIGIAAHPEGHPEVSDDVLMRELEKKQAVANYIVTQMCFEADRIVNWIHRIRSQGITLPVWLGLPSVSDRAALLKTSLRIGVGSSLRFLKNHGNIVSTLLRSKTYRPDDLLLRLEPHIADAALGISGHHIFCFNQVRQAEQWRTEFLKELRQ